MYGKRLTRAVAVTAVAVLAMTAAVFADDISNNLDASIDAVAEVMPLVQGGGDGSTTLYATPQNGDGKNGCNLTGSTTLGLTITSSDTSVATVSPAAVTFESCGDTKILTVTPVSQGTATISASQASNNTGATFNLAPVTFTVNVTPPPNTPPSIVVAGVTGGATYNKGSVPAATCQVTDAEDGNSSFPATLGTVTGPYASDGIGSQTASCSYTDGGGLTASASETYSIVDPSPPSISYVLNPSSPDGDNGWYQSNVTLTWTVGDPESPNSLIKTGCVDQNITADQTATAYSCSATSAGGTDGPVTVSIKRDGTSPQVAYTSASAGANAAGWYNTDVVATFTATDNLSGFDTAGTSTTTGTSTTSGEGTAVTVGSPAFTDHAGNTVAANAATSDAFKIDKTAPAVSVTGVTNGATYILGSVPSAGCSTVETLSGVKAATSLQVSGGPVGTVTATCSAATDNADNTGSPASVTYSVIYNWSGFFRPVDNGGVFNVVKAGSAIPMKFSLAGNQGLNIFAAGNPVSYRAIPCDGTAALDAIEETVTAGYSSLSYDTLADQYNYVWKTDKAWGGSCRQFTMTLADGTTHTANFKFTK